MEVMKVNGKEYVTKERTENENTDFIVLLATAESSLSQALSCVTYPSFPKLNEEMIAKLQNIIREISTIEDDVSYGNTPLIKPIENKAL